MSKSIENLFEEARMLRMQEKKREAMRSALLLHMREHPAIPEKRAFFASLIWRRKFVLSYVFTFVLTLMLGGGLSAAARTALPGEALYPFKVHINEEVKSVLTFTRTGRAELAMKRADLRLKEAETLAAEGKLDANAMAEVEKNFKKHSADFDANITGSGSNNGNEAAAQASSDFEALLRAHAGILAALGQGGGATATSTPILATVRQQVKNTAELRAASEEKVGAGNQADVKTAAEGRRTAAEQKIGEVRTFVQDPAGLDEKITGAVQIRLRAAQDTLRAGDERFSGENYTEAFALYQQAHRIAQEAKLAIDARMRLNVNFSIPSSTPETEGANTASPPQDNGQKSRGSQDDSVQKENADGSQPKD